LLQFFIASSALEFVLSWAGAVLFCFFIIYDTQVLCLREFVLGWMGRFTCFDWSLLVYWKWNGPFSITIYSMCTCLHVATYEPLYRFSWKLILGICQHI
jgi:FtsH-binding integral membrane protein